MERKWFLYIGTMVLLILVASIVTITKPKIVSQYDSEVLPVLANKAWTIQFSKRVDQKSVIEDLVHVKDEAGERQDVTLSLSEDQKTITVFPPKEGYQLHETFTLYIDKDIKTPVGRKLSAGKQISFIVKEDLPKVGSKEKLDKIFQDAISEAKRNQKTSFFSFGAVKEDTSNESASDNASAGAGEQSHSETNVQVQGVDEADIVKTDGSHIYQIVDGTVHITKAVPATTMKLITSIKFEQSFSPTQLFLYENQLIVIGYSYKYVPTNNSSTSRKMIYPPQYFDSTTAIVYDIKDPGKPEQIRKVEVEGHHVTSRRIDNFIYLVANHYPNYWIMEERKNNDMDLRPRFSDSTSGEETTFIDYDEIQYMPDSKETNFTLIAAFNLDEHEEEASITSYLGSGDQLYMSKENLYMAVANYHAIPYTEDYSYTPDTSIYKFSIQGKNVSFHSSAEVSGTVLNQFSMDEYKGNFRVATTKGDTWNNDRPSSNNLFILDENLRQIGSLSDLARGEKIYSARFMQDRIYIVTFKEVDPLFVIDASKPENPTILGELKIPGFSNYLHPYDENHLIGFGHDTKIVAGKNPGEEPMVYTDGVKISLFDVRDVSNPKEKFSEVIGGRGTYSPLNYDHKALLFNKEKGIFAFPISIYQNIEGKEFEQIFEFQGAYVYDISPDGILLKTKIAHDNGQYQTWEGEINRLVSINNQIYAISPTKITAHTIGDYKQVGEIDLR
ncbi:beta-propeller domain-containing protein [Fredinandcohnia sp. 179-A 10B2 NHS]|uniref:beta-propeller domain-containing protein n=1 Tax=Fredinandcohnia sp. 179-A 10B2 NHS TaxID=3235176 RepID=UPI00399F2861